MAKQRYVRVCVTALCCGNGYFVAETLHPIQFKCSEIASAITLVCLYRFLRWLSVNLVQTKLFTLNSQVQIATKWAGICIGRIECTV